MRSTAEKKEVVLTNIPHWKYLSKRTKNANTGASSKVSMVAGVSGNFLIASSQINRKN